MSVRYASSVKWAAASEALASERSARTLAVWPASWTGDLS